MNKNAMITIAGRPNVGKSTLTNTFVGEKVAIVTNKPQTTRNRICAVLNRGNTQFVFLDTPGFHTPKTKLGSYMVQVAKESIANVDAVLLIVEPIPNIGPQEEALIRHISELKIPALLVINKIDTVQKEALLQVMDLYSKAFAFEAIVPISALHRDGIEDLLNVLEQYSKDGSPLFPDGMVSDQPEKQVISEILREKLLYCLEREVPHGTAVEVTKFSERENEIIDVEVTIYCEKTSHKGIIIGKNGAMLKKIGELARIDMEAFMGTRIYLQTWVKVKENWRDSQIQIRNFGYTE